MKAGIIGVRSLLYWKRWIWPTRPKY